MDRLISRIIAASLFIIPLCGSLSIGPFLVIHDARLAKEFLVIITCLSVIIFSFIQRGRIDRHVRNWPLYALIVFLPISIYCSPPVKLIYGSENLAGMWIWKSLAWVMIYWLFYEAAIRIRIPDNWCEFLGKIICWAAILSSIYAIFQAAGLDQFQFTRHNTAIGNPAAKHITALIGCPTYLAIWLVMCLPFLFAYAKWPWWILIAIAIVFCKSDIGIGGLVLMVCLWPAFRARRTTWLITGAVAVILVLITLWASWGHIRPKITDNGRFTVWEQTIKDWNGPCILMPVREDMTPRQKIEVQIMNSRTYPLTGRGMGSFPFMYSVAHNSKFDSPHNEYLHFPYTIGLIGLALALAVIGFVLWISFLPARGDLFLSACYVSFFYSCIAAGGISLWQEEPLRYLSAICFIFLSRNHIGKTLFK